MQKIQINIEFLNDSVQDEFLAAELKELEGEYEFEIEDGLSDDELIETAHLKLRDQVNIKNPEYFDISVFCGG